MQSKIVRSGEFKFTFTQFTCQAKFFIPLKLTQNLSYLVRASPLYTNLEPQKINTNPFNRV